MLGKQCCQKSLPHKTGQTQVCVYIVSDSVYLIFSYLTSPSMIFSDVLILISLIPLIINQKKTFYFLSKISIFAYEMVGCLIFIKGLEF